MNLHQDVSGAIAAVNPFISVTVRLSTGSTLGPAGERTPNYDTHTGVRAQLQPLSTDDLRQVDSLNLQGEHRAIYLNGAIAGLVRPTGQGGDLVTLPDGSVWLVTVVPEQWPDWCHAVITLQNGS